MSDLSQKKCVACEGGMPPLSREESIVLMRQTPQWALSEDGKKIGRSFAFADFKAAMAFANSVAALAEAEGHHPDLRVGWGKVAIELTTHAIDGLSENDFILAAKIDTI